MGGKSKSQTTGYKYYMGLHMGLCHGPVDALLDIRAGDRSAWAGESTASESIAVNAPKLFGGDEKEGGIVGMVDVMMGEPTQLRNEYLESKLGADRPAYRGIFGLVFRGARSAERSLFGSIISGILNGMSLGGGGLITSNNPYIKPWSFKVRRILQGWKGGTAWYSAKAEILLAEGSGTGPAGNVWLSYDGFGGDYYLGNYDGSAWTPLTTDLPGLVPQDTVCANMVGGYAHMSPNGVDAYSAPVSNLANWTASTKVWGSGKTSVSDGTYLYAFSSGSPINRKSLPSGAWTDVSSASNDSYFDDMTVMGGDIYAINSQGHQALCVKSNDRGATWSQLGNLDASLQATSASIGNNGARLVAAFTLSAGNVRIKYSDDNGATWSADVYTFASSSGAQCIPNGCRYWNDKFWVILTNGRCAYSSDGGSWTSGTTMPRGAVTTVAYAVGKVVCGTDYTEHYETTDHGANWALMAGPGTGSISDFIYTFWIGESTAGDYIPSVKAMNPAHIVYECLTSSEWGMGYDSSIIDATSFTDAADVFHAEGLGLCLQWMRQESIAGFIKMVMDHCGGVIVEDRTTGLIQLKPLRGDYDIGTLPEFGSELGNVIEMRRFERAAITDTINEVSVSYTDVVNGKTGSVAVQNLAAVQASGRVISQSVDYPGLPTMDLALRTALRDLTAYTSGLARVHLTVTRAGYALTPGDVIRFSWLPDGIDQMVLRVVAVDYGSLVDGRVLLECLEDVFGLPAATYVAQQATGWVEPDSIAQPPAATTAFEAPYRELLAVLGRAETEALSDEAGYVSAVAARAPGFNLCYELHTRTGSDPYTDTGTGDWCPSGTITANITAATTSITLTAADGIELVVAGSLAMLGTGATAEMVRVETVDADTLVLTIARGCLDTVPKPWALGTRFWAVDDASAGSTTEYATTEVVDVKLLTRTSTELLALSAVSSTPVTMNQRQIRPYPPAQLRLLDDLNTVTGLAYPLELAGALTTNWAHRDRLLQADQIIDESAASIGPEAGTTYTVRYYQPPATLVNTESGIGGTAATPYTFPADGPAQITVEAVRAGFGSWQLADHTFDYYRYPRITTVAGEPRITDDGSARKVI